MSDEKGYMGELPTHCQKCNLPLGKYFIAGKERSGAEGSIMCEDCHTLFGIGLGEGRGQRYETATGSLAPAENPPKTALIPFNILEAVVIKQRSGTDLVNLTATFPSAVIPYSSESLRLSFEATAGTGADYVRSILGVEPRVIEEGRPVNNKWPTRDLNRNSSK